VKAVYVIRHGDWQIPNDRLTPSGLAGVAQKADLFPEFAAVYTSPMVRTQQTAEIIGRQKPQADERATRPYPPEACEEQIAKIRDTHPLGIAGALFSIPEAHSALQAAGQKLVQLIQEALDCLDDGQSALIVTHDGTMCAAEYVMRHKSFDTPLHHTYGTVEGYIVDQDMRIRKL